MWAADVMIPTPELVTAPTAEPVSLEELRLHCRLDVDDDDEELVTLGIAARQWFETALDRQLVTATWRIKLPYFYAWQIELPYPPLRSVGSITYKDTGGVTRTLATSVYQVVTTRTPGFIQLRTGQTWPVVAISDPEAVTITFDAGYGTPQVVPDLVKAGIKFLVAHWYVNREAVGPNTAMSTPLGVDSIVAATRAYRF